MGIMMDIEEEDDEEDSDDLGVQRPVPRMGLNDMDLALELKVTKNRQAM